MLPKIMDVKRTAKFQGLRRKQQKSDAKFFKKHPEMFTRTRDPYLHEIADAENTIQRKPTKIVVVNDGTRIIRQFIFS